MYAAELITNSVMPVNPADSIQKALDRMAELKVRQLPLVENGQFIGLVTETDIAMEADHAKPIGELALSLVNPYVLEHQHVYDVIWLFYEQQLTVVPVLTDNKAYLGLITLTKMNEYFAGLTSSAEPGGIIVLEIGNRDNSLAQMAQIVESDNAQVLSSYIRTFPESTRLEVTLKVNKRDISNIISTFSRYGYDVKATFNNAGKEDGSRERYDSLMNYLSI